MCNHYMNDFLLGLIIHGVSLFLSVQANIYKYIYIVYSVYIYTFNLAHLQHAL